MGQKISKQHLLIIFWGTLLHHLTYNLEMGRKMEETFLKKKKKIVKLGDRWAVTYSALAF